MSDNQPSIETPTLENIIDSVLTELNSVNADSDEFAKMVDQLEKLYKIKDTQKPDRVKMDTLLPVVGNLFGIVAILGFERAHVVTSKALSFVLKTKV